MKKLMFGRGILTIVLALVLFTIVVPMTWARGRGEAPLVLYTNSASLGRGEWIIEQSRLAGFEVQILPLGGGALTDRLVLERENPVADLVFGINAVDFTRLVDNDLLVHFVPTWLDKIDPSLAHSGGLYYAMGITPPLMFYNTDVHSGANVPRDWVDLATNAAYRNRYMLLGLGGGTARMIIASILIAHADPNGTLGVSDRGWDVMRQFIQNGRFEQSGEDMVGMVIEGNEYSIGQHWLAGHLGQKRVRNATNIDFLVPPEGLPYVWEGVGIIKTGRNEARALEWVNWFGGADIQSQWAIEFSHVPTNRDTFPNLPQEVQAALARMHPMDIDWSLAARYLDSWMERIILEFVP